MLFNLKLVYNNIVYAFKNFNIMNKNRIAIIALLIVPISGLGVDIYVPSLPYVARFFLTSEHMVQYTVTIYLAGYAISQFCAGLISDIYGRRVTTLISLAIFMIMGIIIIYSESIYYVLLFRLIQGFSVGFFASSQRATMVDLFQNDETKLHHMMNYITIAWSIGPIIAPAIGGYLQHIFSWQANFIFLIIYSGVVLLLYIVLVPETLQTKNKFHFPYIKESFQTILGTRKFNYALLCCGSLYTITISFSTIGSFIIQTRMGFSAIIFGYCALLLGVCWFIGSVLNRLIQQYLLGQKVIIASRITLIIIICSFALSFKFSNIYILIIPIMLLNIFGGVVFSNYIIFTATMFPKFAGNAGSLAAGGCLIFTAVFGSLLSRIIPTNTSIPLMLAYLILILFCFILSRMIFRQVK